jgi:hypothetical protein
LKPVVVAGAVAGAVAVAENDAVNPVLDAAMVGITAAADTVAGVTMQAGVLVKAVAKVTVQAVGDPEPIVTIPATLLLPCARDGAVPHEVSAGP